MSDKLKIDIPSRAGEAQKTRPENLIISPKVSEPQESEPLRIEGQYPFDYPSRHQPIEDLSPSVLKEKVSETNEDWPPDDYPMNMWVKVFRLLKSRVNKLFAYIQDVLANHTEQIAGAEEKIDEIEGALAQIDGLHASLNNKFVNAYAKYNAYGAGDPEAPEKSLCVMTIPMGSSNNLYYLFTQYLYENVFAQWALDYNNAAPFVRVYNEELPNSNTGWRAIRMEDNNTFTDQVVLKSSNDNQAITVLYNGFNHSSNTYRYLYVRTTHYKMGGKDTHFAYDWLGVSASMNSSEPTGYSFQRIFSTPSGEKYVYFNLYPPANDCVFGISYNIDPNNNGNTLATTKFCRQLVNKSLLRVAEGVAQGAYSEKSLEQVLRAVADEVINGPELIDMGIPPSPPPPPFDEPVGEPKSIRIVKE